MNTTQNSEVKIQGQASESGEQKSSRLKEIFLHVGNGELKQEALYSSQPLQEPEHSKARDLGCESPCQARQPLHTTCWRQWWSSCTLSPENSGGAARPLSVEFCSAQPKTLTWANGQDVKARQCLNLIIFPRNSC